MLALIPTRAHVDIDDQGGITTVVSSPQVNAPISGPAAATITTTTTTTTDQAHISRIEYPPRGVWVWVEAGRWLGSICVGASCSVLVAWLATYTISRGLLFSGQSPTHQSRTIYLAASLFWQHLCFCCSVCLLRSVSLFRLHMQAHPDRPAGVRAILTRMARRTLPWFIISQLLTMIVGQLFTHMDTSWRKFKPEMYFCVAIDYSFVVAADLAARRIYRGETVEGAPALHGHRRISRPGAAYTIQRGCRLAASNISIFFALFVPMLFVHVVSIAISAVAEVPTMWFIAANLAFKWALQEASKHYIVTNGISNPRTMAALVGVPTVIVDTQIRIVFLRFQSSQSTLASTLILACLELVLRVTKSLVLKRKLRARLPSLKMAIHLQASPRRVVPLQPFPLRVDTKRAQLLHYSIIELSSTMFAEYVAIGSSGAIVVFFAPSPQYVLGSALSLSFGKSLKALGVQVVVEMVVDYISCVVELYNGNRLAYFDRERGFLFLVFASVTLLNINLSSVLYLAN